MMWPFDRTTSRRREIRRSRAERALPWHQRLGEFVQLRPLLITVTAALLTSVVITAGGEVLDLRVGQWMPRSITARVPFRIEDQQQTAALRVRASETAPDYYVLDTAFIDDLRGRFQALARITREHAADPARLRGELVRLGLTLDEALFEQLPRLAQESNGAFLPAACDQLIDTLSEQPLIEPDATGARGGALDAILVERDGGERTLPARNLLNADAEGALRAAREAVKVFPTELRENVATLVLGQLRQEKSAAIRPLYRHDAARSAEAARRASAAVPMQYIEYARDYPLCDVGAISEAELRQVREEFATFKANRRHHQAAGTWGAYAEPARGLLGFLVVLGLGLYISLYRETQLRSTVQQVLIALLLIGDLFVVRAAFVQTGVAYYAVGGQAFAAALLAIVYPQGSIFALCGMLALLMVFATQQSIGFFVVLLVVSMICLFGLKDIRNRGKIVFVGCLAAAAALPTAAIVGLSEGQMLVFAFWHQALPAVMTTLAAAFLAEGILPAMERFFGITTSMTLLEWCDASKPLLRLMAAEAPGTYNHSLMVGTLAEAAAESIGGNGLLTRTGAYYHDIGKINKPEYFVENQQLGGASRHERLTPAMSHLIIIGHVKDGIEMAREYGLPTALHPFIAEHHGTTLVEYFFAAASRNRRPDDPEVPEETFRYPGPRPQSRETAIVMLCDGVEAAVRAMPEPTAGRIEDTVTKVVQKRLLDGQLDECDLTFREVETISRALIKSLCSIYHARIVYPSDDNESPTKDDKLSKSRAS